jgi:hypothetical protein
LPSPGAYLEPLACVADPMEASYCTLLVSQDKAVVPSHAEVQADLESTEIARKVAAVKKCILMILNGGEYLCVCVCVCACVAVRVCACVCARV